MSLDCLLRDLKEKAAYQEEQLCLLKGQLVTYDETLDKNYELKAEIDNLNQWIEDYECEDELIKNKLCNNFKVLEKKLKKAETDECLLAKENNKLADVCERITEQLNTLKQCENNLLHDINNLETGLKCCQSEICKIQEKPNQPEPSDNSDFKSSLNSISFPCQVPKQKQIEEKCCTVTKLTENLKCKEAEYLNTQRQLDECKTACNRLADVCRNLELELERTKAEIAQIKSQAVLAEEKIRLERETQSNELEVMCQKLKEMELEYSETMRLNNEEQCKVRKLEELTACLRAAADRDRREFETQMQKLKTEIRTVNEKLCRMNASIEELIRDNGCQAAVNNQLESQLRDTECIVERMKNSAKMFNVAGTRSIQDLERDKVALASDVQRKTKKITELEREAGCLRDRIGGWRENVGERDFSDRQWDKTGTRQQDTNNDTLWNRVEELELERYNRRNEIVENRLKDGGRPRDKAKENEDSNKSLWDKMTDRDGALNSGCGKVGGIGCCPPSGQDTFKNNGGCDKDSFGNKKYCCSES